MSEFHAYQPLHTRLIQFQGEVETIYKQAVEERSQEIHTQVKKEVTERLYGPSTPLAKFEKMKVTQANAPTFTAIYKLLEAYDKVAPDNIDQIESMGKEKGFTPEESLCLYNMSKYARALDNIRSQHEQTVFYVVGKA